MLPVIISPEQKLTYLMLILGMKGMELEGRN